MTAPDGWDGQRTSKPLTCAVCHEPFASTDAVVYLTAEKLLMHRACCDAHPSCHCAPSTVTDTAGTVAR